MAFLHVYDIWRKCYAAFRDIKCRSRRGRRKAEEIVLGV
jgi:hypothetical protein